MKIQSESEMSHGSATEYATYWQPDIRIQRKSIFCRILLFIFREKIFSHLCSTWNIYTSQN